ncbi:hypothetical protein SLS60_005857 [Paraconiothyrium brasiliense]|uniref:Uncharacterized protein n=1 Tax=Paraconiothyrium brasiliense TaxID=300254 RepID=A0ABR3RDB5_9PLEO
MPPRAAPTLAALLPQRISPADRTPPRRATTRTLLHLQASMATMTNINKEAMGNISTTSMAGQADSIKTILGQYGAPPNQHQGNYGGPPGGYGQQAGYGGPVFPQHQAPPGQYGHNAPYGGPQNYDQHQHNQYGGAPQYPPPPQQQHSYGQQGGHQPPQPGW